MKNSLLKILLAFALAVTILFTYGCQALPNDDQADNTFESESVGETVSDGTEQADGNVSYDDSKYAQSLEEALERSKR